MATKRTNFRFPEADKQRALDKAKSIPTTLTTFTLLGWNEMEKKPVSEIKESLKTYNLDTLGRRNARMKG